MRLAQLARKLGVKSADIVEFLAHHQHVVEDSFNAKLSDTLVELVEQKFSPHQTDENGFADNISGIAPSDKPASRPDLEPTALENDRAEEAASEEAPTEVIRAYKVPLPGLKVVGKIILPEPKVKGEEVMKDKESPEPLDNRRRKKSNPIQQEHKPRKNPIALQRERKEREARERREAQKMKEKELRKQRYQEKVSKYTPPPKPIAKLRNDDYEVYEEPKKQPAKTWMGKIAGWFVSD